MVLLSESEIVAQRVFNTLYIYIDIVFLLGLCALLIIKKRYCTFLFGLFGGVLYMIVDYGIFHLALGTRSIEGGNLFAVLMWMSMSYGITNFVWIWLWMAKDRRAFEYTLLIAVWWIAAPMIASTFGSGMPQIKIQRTTGAYHGYMALILLVGYAAAIVYNMFTREKSARFPLVRLLAIGISVQFAWEFSLLIGGIRSAQIVDWASKIQTLVVNSLLETNLGAVPIFCIYLLISGAVTEQLKLRKPRLGFTARMTELNQTSARDRDGADIAPQTNTANVAQNDPE